MDMDVQLLTACGVIILINIILSSIISLCINNKKVLNKEEEIIQRIETLEDKAKTPLDDSSISDYVINCKDIKNPSVAVVRTSKKRTRMDPVKLKYAVDNLKTGMSRIQVCNRLNISSSTLCKWVTYKGELTRDGKVMMKRTMA